MVMREHDGYKNMYSLKKDEKTFTLITLSLREAYEDQLKLKGESKAKEKDQPYEI
jgi:chloramphenicol O-acetyltransferase